MAYIIDANNEIVLNGMEKGIGDSPFEGISDMRNINIASIPGEGSVNFSTVQISAQSFQSISVTSANTGTDRITFVGANGIELHQAIIFSGTSLPAPLVAGTVYWVGNVSGQTMTLYSDYQTASLVDITTTGTPGNWTFSTVDINQPKYFTYAAQYSYYFMVDKLGQVWSNAYVTAVNSYWTFTGNKVPNSGDTIGNGIVYYQASDGTGYLFLFHNSSIDYTVAANSLINWVYGWKWTTDGSSYGYLAVPNSTLKSSNGSNNPHEAIVAPDNKVYFVDANWMGRFYQKSPTVAFDPTTPSTYVWDQTALLPFTEVAQCIAPLGNNLLIGGSGKTIYPWDTFSSLPSYPILLAEYNVQKLLTVNTNTYILVGNRGRVYVTSGSQAQLYKKLPDHISGTVEPYFQWGGIMSNKNQLYVSAKATTNAQAAISQYGGLWAIDLDTKALRLSNQLSYGAYSGYATCCIPNFGTNPAGTGFFAGWDNNGAYGIDTTSSNPYTGSQATIDFDLIPIGTFNRQKNFERVEYRLTKPMVSGESVTIYARLIFNTTDTGFGSAILTDSTVGNFSNSKPVNFKNAQWLQLKVVLNSTASSPSYTRLKEIRITGLK